MRMGYCIFRHRKKVAHFIHVDDIVTLLLDDGDAGQLAATSHVQDQLATAKMLRTYKIAAMRLLIYSVLQSIIQVIKTKDGNALLDKMFGHMDI